MIELTDMTVDTLSYLKITNSITGKDAFMKKSNRDGEVFLQDQVKMI